MGNLGVEAGADASAAAWLPDMGAYLFDLDNTLVETHIDFDEMRRSTLALAEEWGVHLGDSADGLDILAIVERVTAILHSITMSGADRNFHEAAYKMLAEQERRECANPTELPGAREMLHALDARGVPIGVVTRNCRMVSDQLLADMDLPCDVLLAREDVAHTKPHPDHLRDALRVLQIKYPDYRLQASGCVMVGDNVMDIRAGRSAGMRTIGLRRGHSPDAFKACEPDLLVEDMAELWTLYQQM